MKIAVTLDGVISEQPYGKDNIDNDLFCLNQICTEDGWYASNRWFAAGNDIFLITSRKNSEMTERWLAEWAVMYNRTIYEIPIHYHYNTAVALGCDIFITASYDELPKHGTHEVRTYFYSQESIHLKIPQNIIKINHLNAIDEVIAAWPLHPKQSSVRTVGISRT